MFRAVHLVTCLLLLAAVAASRSGGVLGRRLRPDADAPARVVAAAPDAGGAVTVDVDLQIANLTDQRFHTNVNGCAIRQIVKPVSTPLFQVTKHIFCIPRSPVRDNFRRNFNIVLWRKYLF